MAHSQSALAGVVERPRLYQILDAPQGRVCVVQGPSGSGKSTLLRSWAFRHGQSESIIWVSLSESQTTRQAFWGQVVGAVTRFGGPALKSAAGVREQAGLPQDPAQVAQALLIDAGSITVVLDGYEHLGESQREVEEELARLVDAEPELRLVVTTRGHSTLSDLDLPGEGVRTVTARDLALTAEEIGELISAQAGIEDERLVASVARATGGFAVTVRAVVLALSQLGHIADIHAIDWGVVMAAKLESLLHDAAAVQFLTDTSIPSSADAELATLLTGYPDAAGMFALLEDKGFGSWVSYANQRQVFHYVETIQDSFRVRAAGDPERFRRNCTITATWLLDKNEALDQAVQFAVAAEDYALADRIAPALIVADPDSYLTDRFLAILQKVPESVLPDYPMLAFGLALALVANPMLRTEASRIARIAADSEVHRSYGEPAIDEFLLASVRAVARRLAGDYRRSADEAAVALSLLPAVDTTSVEPMAEQLGTALGQLGYSLFQGGRIDEAMTALSQSVALSRTQTTRNYSIVYAAGMQAFAGNLPRAKALMATLDIEAWPAELRYSPLSALGILAKGYACLDALDFTRALDVFRGAQSYFQTTESWCLLAGIAVPARHGAGQACAAADWLDLELTDPVPPPGVGDNIATEHLYGVHALAQLAAGDQRAAAQTLERTRPDSPHTAGARIRLLLAAERYREAYQQAEALVDLSDHTIRTRAQTQTIGAVAAVRAGEIEPAWSWLNAAVVSWETYGVRLHVAMLSPSDRRLLWDFAGERDAASLRRYLDLSASEIAQERRTLAALTPRESTVLAALAEHSTNRAIANALVVSPHTVKTQLQSIYRKLGVSSRRSALAVARESGLLGTPK